MIRKLLLLSKQSSPSDEMIEKIVRNHNFRDGQLHCILPETPETMKFRELLFCMHKSAEQSNRMEEIMAKQAAKIN